MKVSVLGIDLGKNVCSIVGFDETGAVVLRRRAKRETLIGLAAKLPPRIVAMEACCGAHHLARLFANQGHDVRLMSPEYVRPYIKAQKNDDRDAEGIAEAATRPTMRFVEVKAQEQLDIQTLHRSRDRLVAERTSPGRGHRPGPRHGYCPQRHNHRPHRQDADIQTQSARRFPVSAAPRS
jgi:transposase